MSTVGGVQILEIQSKTQQKVRAVISILKGSDDALTYAELIEATRTSQDILLYILTTLCEIGLVERTEVISGPGRPKVYFRWTGRARRSKAAEVASA